jgi:hypothetical protein
MKQVNGVMVVACCYDYACDKNDKLRVNLGETW